MRPSAVDLTMSLVRALWGNVYPQLRAASIELTEGVKLIRLRFEYDGAPTEEVRDACESASAEVIADFWQGYEFDVQHIATPQGTDLQPLSTLVYRRGEM